MGVKRGRGASLDLHDQSHLQMLNWAAQSVVVVVVG